MTEPLVPESVFGARSPVEASARVSDLPLPSFELPPAGAKTMPRPVPCLLETADERLSQSDCLTIALRPSPLRHTHSYPTFARTEDDEAILHYDLTADAAPTRPRLRAPEPTLRHLEPAPRSWVDERSLVPSRGLDPVAASPRPVSPVKPPRRVQSRDSFDDVWEQSMFAHYDDRLASTPPKRARSPPLKVRCTS